MRLGLYTFATLAFVGLVAGIVYTLVPGNYVLEVAGLNLNLPIALWIILPLLLLLLLTILHMLYHGTRNYFVRRRWQRDVDTVQDALYWSLIKEPKEHRYAIPQIAEWAALLSSSTLDLKSPPKGISSKLAKTVEWIEQIENGEYVDLKKLKIERYMSKDNPLLVKNQINHIEKEIEFADEILRAREAYTDEVVSVALKKVVKHDTLSKLQRYVDLLDFDDLAVLLDRADAGEDIGLTLENIEKFIDRKELNCPQCMRIVSIAIDVFDPDQNIAFFKALAKENSQAQAAYLFLLFRYEMIEKAENFLNEHEDDEFRAFRAFLALKKSKYNYKVRDFITTDNACKQ